MALPISILRGLQMPTRYKISLAIIFLLGAFGNRLLGDDTAGICGRLLLCPSISTTEKFHVVAARYKSFLSGIWSTTGTRSDQTSKDVGAEFERVESGPENDSWVLDRSKDEILPGSTAKNMTASYPLGTITVRSTVDIV
ncbi:hypothetical protein BPAE_0035g00220 [Botrytis paeoniae]|uniref:Uncharacterized protein n=1 Tax=Botrytis paeoniae TaxID=278948 RepID=A0A4Z1FYB3_9HELO|nr:hypothetical protein BPAE_0035g00220 [Botrytis paeoniae]